MGPLGGGLCRTAIIFININITIIVNSVIIIIIVIIIPNTTTLVTSMMITTSLFWAIFPSCWKDDFHSPPEVPLGENGTP